VPSSGVTAIASRAPESPRWAPITAPGGSTGTPGDAFSAPVQRAIDAVRQGELVVVHPSSDVASGGALMMAAEAVTCTAMAFMIRHTSGLICIAMNGDRLVELGIPQMVAEPHGDVTMDSAFAVAVDAATGVTTGISAADRAVTTRILADPTATPGDLVRPGHVLPLRAHAGGVLGRQGFTEAAVDLSRLAGMQPVGVFAEIVCDDGQSPRQQTLVEFAREHGLAQIAITDVVRASLSRWSVVEDVAQQGMSTQWGEFVVHRFASKIDGRQHFALQLGEPAGVESPLVRLHVECLAGDVFASRSCPCGNRLRESLGAIAGEGAGVVVYVREEDAHSTASRDLVDSHRSAVGAQVLRALGITRMRLLVDDEADAGVVRTSSLEVQDLTILAAGSRDERSQHAGAHPSAVAPS
jgi:3,4-dihydroxy 2-butanone 4-phosphate synthase/GTP cyclohydrolase II